VYQDVFLWVPPVTAEAAARMAAMAAATAAAMAAAQAWPTVFELGTLHGDASNPQLMLQLRSLNATWMQHLLPMCHYCVICSAQPPDNSPTSVYHAVVQPKSQQALQPSESISS
jgi:hypothetical protein